MFKEQVHSLKSITTELKRMKMIPNKKAKEKQISKSEKPIKYKVEEMEIRTEKPLEIR